MKKKSKLTINEKKILKKIVDRGRISDTEISKSMPVSQQAVYQMRKNLEEMGVIEGYIPIINFKKLGIKIFNLVGIKVMSSVWKEFSEEEINRRINDIPFLFFAFRVSSSDISYLLVLGFRNLEEEERFSKNVEIRLAGKMRVKWKYSTGVENMLSYDSLNIVLNSLNNKCNIREEVEKLTKK
jgi:DNA-binding Lrp family transcriptional regulator